MVSEVMGSAEDTELGGAKKQEWKETLSIVLLLVVSSLLV